MSQCSRVLEVLRDGKPHSIQEIHERAGTMRLNSRISDLRKMGWFITYYREDGLHIYKLLYGTVRTGDAAGGAVGDMPSPVRTTSTCGPPEPSASKTPESASVDGDVGGSPGLPREGRQPTLWEAA